MAYAGVFRTFTDPEELAGGLPHCHVAMHPLLRGGFRTEIALVRLEDIDLALTVETLPRRAVLSFRPGRVHFRLVAFDDRPKIRSGREDIPGTLAVGPAELEVDDVTSGPTVSRSLSVPTATMFARAERLLDGGASLLRGPGVTIHPPPETLRRLTHLHRTFAQLSRGTTDAGEWTSRVASMNANLWEILADILVSAEPDPSGRRAVRGQAALRRATEFIHANENRPIALWELCEVAGCSVKTLETLFLRSFGETPNRYMRRQRMWCARDALRAADPERTTVSELAVGYGFWELGRFAVAYRAVFGESPSDTLRKSGDIVAFRTAPVLTNFA